MKNNIIKVSGLLIAIGAFFMLGELAAESQCCFKGVGKQDEVCRIVNGQWKDSLCGNSYTNKKREQQLKKKLAA
ncbi:MAG: hypothetical protein AAGF85_21460 [Bacteroidota bacterium]